MDKKKLDKECITLAKLRKEKDRLAAELKSASMAFEKQMLVCLNLIKETDQKSWEVKGLAKFTPSYTKYFNITNQILIKKILQKEGLDDLIKVNAKSISAWAKEQIDLLIKHDKKLAFDNDKLIEALNAKFGIGFFEKEKVNIKFEGGSNEEADSNGSEE